MAKKTMFDQASAILRQHLALGTPKSMCSKIGDTHYKQFTSVRSFNETSATLAKIANRLGVDRIKHITESKAVEYLMNQTNQKRQNVKNIQGDNKPEYVSQKTIDAERKALSIALKINLPRIYTSFDYKLGSRAYTANQIEAICKHQDANNGLATRVAAYAGLRASELLTIQRQDELKITSGRSWHRDRFLGEEGIKYVVRGKGGLIREVILSTNLANQLENLRRSEPVKVKDRGVNYTSHYKISGGNKFSKSFSDASKRALTFSNGAHGLRHTYVQSRLNILLEHGRSEKEAKLIVSQEVGHFRADVTEIYLR